MPEGDCVCDRAISCSSDFLDEALFVGNPAVEALGRKHAEFGLGQIQPTAVLWSVVPFEALHQPPGCVLGIGSCC
jgi:hypothetical protein